MTKKELAELLKYSFPKELWIITWNNVLRRLFCPFEVRVIRDVGTLKKGQLLMVDEIKVTLDLKTVYIINEKAYYYYHFDILV